MNEEKLIESIIKLAIEEDIATGDITTDSIIPVSSVASAEMTMKADGVVSGEERLNKLMASLPAMPFEINRKRASNLVEVATLIIRSALERRESRGGHFREDYPHENEKYLYHIIQRLGADIETIPVDN